VQMITSMFRGWPKHPDLNSNHQSPLLAWLPYTGAILLLPTLSLSIFFVLLQKRETRPWILVI